MSKDAVFGNFSSFSGVLIFCTLSLVGCEQLDVASPGSMPASEQQIQDALVAQITCMRKQTALLDDGVSDAGTIGRAVAISCRAESEHAAKVFVSGKSKSAQSEFLKSARDGEAELATRVVLQMRAEKS